MERHISIVAALHIGLSIMGIFFGMVLLVLVFATDIFIREPYAMSLLSILIPVIVFFIFLLCILTIIGGIGLFVHKNWARILIMILSAIDLFNIPVGTAVGIYSFWVLVQEDTAKIFASSNS
jgi:hypothetical protein